MVNEIWEEMLVLCQAYPAVSARYEITICMAGITRDGEFRRIYPMPFENWQQNPISKRSWIRYKLRETSSSDGRKESRKIDPSSVQIIGEASYDEIRNILEDRVTSIEEMLSSGNSLAIVRPLPRGFTIEDDPDREEKAKKLKSQQTLDGKPLDFYICPKRLAYQFRCKTIECNKEHDIMCEDWEAIVLYRKYDLSKQDNVSIESKVRVKLYDWMFKERDLYFMIGTHSRFGTPLIISLLYPQKRTALRLDSFE